MPVSKLISCFKKALATRDLASAKKRLNFFKFENIQIASVLKRPSSSFWRAQKSEFVRFCGLFDVFFLTRQLVGCLLYTSPSPRDRG